MPDIRELFESMEYGPAPEDAAAARQWISDHDSLFGHWINGDWTEATSHFDSVNPATGDMLARVSRAGSKEIDAAVAAARVFAPQHGRPMARLAHVMGARTRQAIQASHVLFRRERPVQVPREKPKKSAGRQYGQPQCRRSVPRIQPQLEHLRRALR